MLTRLNRESPVPLYHQLAEALRHGIATGELRAGARLMPVREFAIELGVNLHTVRRAYGELVREGLLESRGPAGTHVIERSVRDVRDAALTGPAAWRFVARMRSEALRRYRLSPDALARLVVHGPHAAVESPDVYFVECSESQCLGHCRELEATWNVRAHAWPLNRGEPPQGSTVICTYFHYNDVRRQWPKRLRDVRFVAIRPDASLERRLRERLQTYRHTPRVLVCEFSESRAMNVAADLAAVVKTPAVLIPLAVRRATDAFAHAGRGQLILMAPRLWATLPARHQADSRAVELRYVVPPEEMNALGEQLGWVASREQPAARHA